MRPARYAWEHTCLSLVGGKTRDWVFARLVVATAVAIVMEVGVFVHAFDVVVVVVARAALVLGIRAEIRVRMLGFRPMYMAGLLTWRDLREEPCGHLREFFRLSCVDRGCETCNRKWGCYCNRVANCSLLVCW